MKAPSHDVRPPTSAADFAARPLIHWFCDRGREQPERVAFRHKDWGIYKEITWAQYQEQVELFALGLLELGLQAGDRVAIMGDPTPEWLYADLGTQSVGSISYGIYVTTPPPDLHYLIQNGGARFFVAEDQEYVDKLLASETDAQVVEWIIVADMRGMFAYKDKRLRSFEAVQNLGRRRREREPNLWPTLVSQRRADEVIRIFYTSGTTGAPKGAMISSRNLVFSGAGMFAWMKKPPGPTDRTVAYMPLGHNGETVFSIILPILFGSVPHIPEDEDSVRESLIEVSPTILFGFPRVWETYVSQALVDIETGSWLKRTAYHLAMAARRRLFQHVWAQRRPPVLLRLAGWLTYWTVFRHLLDKFGFRQLRLVLTGGAPVSPDVTRLWHIWGVHIRELYGMTECGGMITVQTDRSPRPGLAGPPIPGAEVRLDHDGEILVRSPGTFHGYWQNPEATAKTVDSQGWVHTGDLGEFLPDGNLRVIDRKADVLITAQGKVVPSSEIEHVLKYSPYIRDAMLVGDGRSYLTVLLEVDFENLAEWARSQGVAYTSFTNLALNPQVDELLHKEMIKANEILRERRLLNVNAFRVLPKELDPEAGDEITPTRKVKRRQLAMKFSTLVEEMYRTETSELISKQVSKPAKAVLREERS